MRQRLRSYSLLGIFLLLLTGLIICVGFYSAYANPPGGQHDTGPVNNISGLELQCSYFGVDQVIYPWEDDTDGTLYFFVPTPSYTSAKIAVPAGNTLVCGDLPPMTGFIDTDSLPHNQTFTLQLFANETLLDSRQVQLATTQSTAVLYIQTQIADLADIHADQGYKEPASMMLVSNTGKLEYAGDATFTGRGNGSWNEVKKGYNLTLDDKTGLLGMSPSKKWALIANYRDDAYIRSMLCIDTAGRAGMAYAPASAFADLYVNGEYLGLYQLSEKVQVASNRVDIDDLGKENEHLNPDVEWQGLETQHSGGAKWYSFANEPADNTGGYLFEVDLADRFDNEASGFYTRMNRAVVVKSPEYASKSQIEYIQNFVYEFEDALYAKDGINPQTGKHYTEYIDMESWVKKYLVDEIFKDTDAGVTSDFFYKPSGTQDAVLYAGPCWDMNLSLGGDSDLQTGEKTGKNAAMATGFYANVPVRFADDSANSYWFAALYEKEEFYDLLVYEYVNTFLPLLDELLDTKIDEYMGMVAPSNYSDNARWGAHGDLPVAAAYIKAYLAERIAFLNSAWIDGVEYCSVVVYQGEETYFNSYGRPVLFSIPRGSAFAASPEYSRFIPEYYELTNQDNTLYDANTPVLDDIILYITDTRNSSAA